MSTKNQHYVPRVYIKAWETTVYSRKEPTQPFNGVYYYKKTDLSVGDGRNKGTILSNKHTYTIDYNYNFILSICAEIGNEFAEKIQDILAERKVKAFYNDIPLSSRKKIIACLPHLDNWEFENLNNTKAAKKATVNAIKEVRSYCLEDKFGSYMESNWESVLNAFLTPFPKVDGSGQTNRHFPISNTVLDMLKMTAFMMCRNPAFDLFGIFPWIKNDLLVPAFSQYADTTGIDMLMRGLWLTEIYKGNGVLYWNLRLDIYLRFKKKILHKRSEVMNKIACTFFAFLLSILFVGCGRKIPEPHESEMHFVASENEFSYTGDLLQYHEPFSSSSLSRYMESTQTEYATYYFEETLDTSIAHSERNKCIDATENILNTLAFSNDCDLKIYVFTPESFPSIYISDYSLYLPISDWESPDYVTDLLLAIYGQNFRYGIAYGYANYICEKLGWTVDITPAFSHVDTQDLYDLTLLCFREFFSTTTDIEAAKAISADFVYSFIDANGEASLQSMLEQTQHEAGRQKADALLTEYYGKHGVTVTLSEILYRYGGRTYDFVADTPYAKFYVGKEWTDLYKDSNPLIQGDFLHEDYSAVKDFIETNVAQMQQYQELFSFDDYDNSLAVVLTNEKLKYQFSYYREDHVIFLRNVSSLTHEYIHSITSGRFAKDTWITEGSARYFSYRFDKYGLAFLNYDYNHAPDKPETQFVHKYIEQVNRPIDMAVDCYELEDIAAYTHNYTDPNESYVAASSFFHYLCQEYGEREVIRYCCDLDSAYTELGCTYEELVNNWNEYIREKMN